MQRRFTEDLKDFLYDATMVVLVIIGFVTCIVMGYKILVVGTKIAIIDREIQLVEQKEERDEDDLELLQDLRSDRRKIEQDKNYFAKWYFSLNSFFQSIIYLSFLASYILIFLLIISSIYVRLKSKSNKKRGSPE